MSTKSGIVIVAIPVDEFLETALNQTAMEEEYEFLNAKYRFKRLGRLKRYLGCYFHFCNNGDIGLSQKLLVEQTADTAGMDRFNPKITPYIDVVDYHARPEEGKMRPETITKFQNLVENSDFWPTAQVQTYVI